MPLYVGNTKICPVIKFGAEWTPRKVVDGVLVMPTGTYKLPNNARNLGNYALYHGFYNSGLTSADFSPLVNADGSWSLYQCFQYAPIRTVDFSNLESVNGNNVFYYCFDSCTNLEGIEFPKLETSTSSYGNFTGMCHGCTSLRYFRMPKLKSVYNFQETCSGCTNLEEVDLSSLETTTSGSCFLNAFGGCTKLTEVEFPKLKKISYNYELRLAFKNCTSLTTVSFPALNNDSFGTMFRTQFTDMLNGCSNVTVHFPASIQSKIGSWSDILNGCGGTNTTILFDL